jgi:serine/threonine protein kinase
MADDESRRIRAIFAAALQRDPEERPGYLDEACAGRPDLREKVEKFLQAHAKDFEERVRSLGASPAEKAEVVEGRVIGPYILRRLLGEGGMGVVYLADDTRLSRPVALKALAPGVMREPGSRERLRLEARAAAGLAHPGIATVYALEEIGGQLYLACEYVPGVQLRALLESGPLPINQVVTIGAQLARALVAAHTVGVIHRDIKPENVMKTPSGMVKVLDFGLARMRGPGQTKLTQTGVVVGTPAYMAPEQALGETIDFRTDLFSAGLLLYELAAGKNPFAASTITATLARIVGKDEPPRLSSVRPDSVPELDRILARCLKKNPAERYLSTQELVADFERLETQLSQRSHPTDPSPALGDQSKAKAQWWWGSHQLIVSAFYVLTILPTWYAQKWLGEPRGISFLLFVLLVATLGTSVRLHLRFIGVHSPEELPSQLRLSRVLTLLCDSAFAASLFAGAIGIGAAHPEFAMIFVTVAAAILFARLVIEPAREKAAFGSAVLRN